jgi:hypothetical protein
MSKILWIRIAILTVFGAVVAHTQVRSPKIWDDAALKEWTTPVAALGIRPGHFTSAEYYKVPADNLRTYPVYHPDSEPPGYWDWLQNQKPEPLVDTSKIKTKDDWIAAGQRAFGELDSVLKRTNDPELIARLRDPEVFKGVLKQPNGTVKDFRWVVTEQGVMLSSAECMSCHAQVQKNESSLSVRASTPGSGTAPAARRRQPSPDVGRRFVSIEFSRRFLNEPMPIGLWRMFTVPWAPDERVERIRTMRIEELSSLQGTVAPLAFAGGGVVPRTNGSPFFGTKIPDLRTLRYSRYIDATGTHRLRGAEDVARYAALVTGADPLDFGPHRILTDAQRRVPVRYADEVLYAIGEYLMSLEPLKNPNPAPRAMLEAGEQIFRREGCTTCHAPPAYTNGKLTLAKGYDLPADHPNRDDVLRVSVGTDPGLALKTRKGTGFYKVPSLRGVWYRPLLLHDGSIASLEELFDAGRLSEDYESRGWKPAGVSKRSIPGHPFGLQLKAEEKAALLAFLRSL